MAYSTPKVTIDLAEYNELLEFKKRYSSDLPTRALWALLKDSRLREFVMRDLSSILRAAKLQIKLPVDPRHEILPSDIIIQELP
jgi:uncharacterized ubiquitin-like protein YukD